MSKKLLCLCAAAVLLLSGCSGEGKEKDFPKINVPWNSSRSSFSNSTEADPDESAPTILSAAVFYDPQNDCRLEMTKNSIILTVNSDYIKEVSAGIPSKVYLAENDGESVYTIECEEDFSGYFDLYLSDEEYTYTIRLKRIDGMISLPNVYKVQQKNILVARNAVETSAKITAKYIAKDGKISSAAPILKRIKTLSDNICDGFDSDYDKLRAISQWVSENICYDYPAYKAGVPDECITLEYMLDKRSSVCGGYANMTAALCAAQGIKCMVINGEALTGEYCYAENDDGEHHEWDYAVIDGRGVWVDSGWNSYGSVVEGSFYDIRVEHPIGHFYFDVSSEIFALDHAASSAQYRDFFCKELYGE